MSEKVQARWVGSYAGIMRETGAALDPGSVHEVYPHEAYGETLWRNPDSGQLEALPGISSKPEHAGLPRPVLETLGYQFVEKSANWEPVVPLADWLKGLQVAPPAPLPDAVDLSAFEIPAAQVAAMQQAALEPPADDPEAVEAGAVVTVHKDDDGTLTIVTTPLEPEAHAEAPAEA